MKFTSLTVSAIVALAVLGVGFAGMSLTAFGYGVAPLGLIGALAFLGCIGMLGLLVEWSIHRDTTHRSTHRLA